MAEKSPLAVLWRRKWIVVVTVLVFGVAAAVISRNLEEVYSTEATLLVTLPVKTQSFDTVQASQAVGRSYAEILDSPNVAALVEDELSGAATTSDPAVDDLTSGELEAATSFEAIPETQLLKITAESTDPALAKLIADTYARVFIDYTQEQLEDATTTRVALADTAPLPDGPSRPKPNLYTAVAVLMGLALGIALAFLRDQLDIRLRTAEDVERQFEVPILARIPVRGRSATSKSAFREAYRVLRANVQFAAGDSPIRSVAVVSSEQGEGKSTTATELALAAAGAGLRVVVLEADLRRPTLQTELAPERDGPPSAGFSGYLVGAASLDEAVTATARPNLDYVPAGPLPPSSSALLDAKRAGTVVPELTSRFDFVVVDCPPIAVAADALMISRWVDGVILVVDLRKATTRGVNEALQQLEATDTPVLGLVLNRDRRSGKYDSYYADGGSRDGRARRKATAAQRLTVG